MTQEAVQISTAPPLPGLQLVQDLNKALLALGTDFAGPDDPAALAGPYMTWADTGNMLLKRRSANGAEWIIESTLLSPGMLVLPSAPSSQLSRTIYVEDRQQILAWRTIGAFAGYVSPEVGCISFGTQPNPRPFEVDLIGQTLDKTDPKYAALYAWANAAGLFVSSGSWTAGTYFFAEMSGDLFKVPDLRNQFIRFTGTDIDTANARVLGSKQADALKRHSHIYNAATAMLASGNNSVTAFGGSIVGSVSETGALETRPANIAMHPRMFL